MYLVNVLIVLWWLVCVEGGYHIAIFRFTSQEFRWIPVLMLLHFLIVRLKGAYVVGDAGLFLICELKLGCLSVLYHVIVLHYELCIFPIYFSLFNAFFKHFGVFSVEQ